MTPAENRSWILYYFQRPNQNTNQNTDPQNESTCCIQLGQIFKVHFIDCTDKVAGILVALVGLLTSLWADCILVVSCTQEYDQYAKMELYIEKTIIQTSQMSHFLVVMTCTAGFIYGIEVKNKNYFTPWIFTKVMELCVILFGIVILSTGGNARYIGIIPFGISFFIIGLYITLCVWNTYRNNSLEAGPQSLNEVVHSEQQHRVLLEPPPSYDNYLMQEETSR